METHWYVYIVQCSDHTLYTGITTDIQRRLREHNHGPGGARYTRTRRPVRLIYSESRPGRAAAAKREALIKQMDRRTKFRLIQSGSLPDGGKTDA